jgi:hypothetical protein
MASDRTLRICAAGFAVVFCFVVALGYVPSFNVTVANERMLFGLFMLSPLDDITHGLTAIAAAAAAVHSGRAARLFFTAFGWYYALDAIFFLCYGAVNDKPWLADVLLNLPHVGISSAMLALAYGVRRGAAEPVTGARPRAA